MSDIDFEKAMKDSSSNVARAVRAAKEKRSLHLAEQAMLETFPEETRGAVLAFVRWSEGRKFIGGPVEKARQKMCFIEGFRIAEAAFGPMPEEKPKGGLVTL